MQLFWERLWDKVHATTPKGIVGGFEYTVFQRNLKERQKRPWTYVCECWRKATKVGSTATVSGTVYCAYPILPFGIVECTFFPTTFLETAVYQTCTLHSSVNVACITGASRAKLGKRSNLRLFSLPFASTDHCDHDVLAKLACNLYQVYLTCMAAYS